MPLYIRDNDADELAEQLRRLTGAATKTEAVKTALRHEIERASSRRPSREGLERARRLIDTLGPTDPNFDQKAFSDEMWGDL